MKPKQYRQISTLIHHGEPSLAILKQKADLLIRVKKILIDGLPEELHSHLLIKSIQHSVLELSVTNPAIATKIRHSAPSLLQKINGLFPEFHEKPLVHLQCQVKPKEIRKNVGTIERVKRKAKPLSDHTKQKLNALSIKITHKALAEALQKLAKTTSSSS